MLPKKKFGSGDDITYQSGNIVIMMTATQKKGYYTLPGDNIRLKGF
jgi:hypothetical protein